MKIFFRFKCPRYIIHEPHIRKAHARPYIQYLDFIVHFDTVYSRRNIETNTFVWYIQKLYLASGEARGGIMPRALHTKARQLVHKTKNWWTYYMFFEWGGGGGI